MTACENFWNWFAQHEPELFDFDPDQEAERERLFDEVASELRKVDSDLCFEFGPREKRREFVVSAGGIKRAFPAVTSLIAVAPAMERWQFIAFRPRRTPHIVEFQGKTVNPKDVQFSLIHDGKTMGICLFIPSFRQKDAGLKQIGYLLLDEALGEYDVETRLGPIEMLAPETRTEGTRYPFAELAARFDELVSRLEGHSQKPH